MDLFFAPKISNWGTERAMLVVSGYQTFLLSFLMHFYYVIAYDGKILNSELVVDFSFKFLFQSCQSRPSCLAF